MKNITWNNCKKEYGFSCLIWQSVSFVQRIWSRMVFKKWTWYPVKYEWQKRTLHTVVSDKRSYMRTLIIENLKFWGCHEISEWGIVISPLNWISTESWLRCWFTVGWAVSSESVYIILSARNTAVFYYLILLLRIVNTIAPRVQDQAF